MEHQDSALDGAKSMLEFWISMVSRYLFLNII